MTCTCSATKACITCFRRLKADLGDDFELCLKLTKTKRMLQMIIMGQIRDELVDGDKLYRLPAPSGQS